MNFKVDEIIAVGGSSSLFVMAINKPNGLVLEDMKSKKRRFYTARKHQFTPLGSIAIYTIEDSRPLHEIFEKMHNASIDVEVPSHKAELEQIIEYFDEVMPDYDPDQVTPGDIRKVIKWYNFLNDVSYFQREAEDGENSEEE